MDLRHLAVGLVGLLLAPVWGDSASSAVLRVACVGDSITWGQGVEPRSQRGRLAYPGLLQERLGAGYLVRSFAFPGATATRGSRLPFAGRVEHQAALAFEAQVVLLMLGTNDAGAWASSASASFLRDYRQLVTEFQALPSRPRVIVLIPLPALDNGAEPRQRLRTHLESDVQPGLRRLAAELGLQTIDLPALVAVDRQRMPDGLHPGNAIHAEMAALAAAAVAPPPRAAP
jgi:lysophospholipase L1-like esterase